MASQRLTDVTPKVAIYEAFVEGKLEAPKHLARTAGSAAKNRCLYPQFEGLRTRPIDCK